MANSPKDFGASANDGLDDSLAFLDMFEAGGDIVIPAGQWEFETTVVATLMRSIDVTADAGATFISNGIDGDLFLFRVTAQSPSDLSFSWHGGTFDIIDQKNSLVIPFVGQGAPVKDSGTANTADALSIRGIHQNHADGTSVIKVADVSLSDIRIIASPVGEDWETAGGDSGVFLQAGSATIEDSYFRGLRDDAIYLSADGLFNELGGNYSVENVTIEGSVKGIAVQRGADDVVIQDSVIRDTEIGIVVDGTDDNQSQDVTSFGITIENNTISGAWLGLRLSDVDGITVSNNTISGLIPFEYAPRIPPSDVHFWDDEQIANLSYVDNRRGSGEDYPNLFFGGAADDAVIGTRQGDILIGGAGADTLFGGGGDDLMWGDEGSDTFVFADGHGDDTINGFEATNDLEAIDLSAVTALTSFAQMQASGALQQVGSDVVIDTGSGTITIADTALGDLGQADFVF